MQSFKRLSPLLISLSCIGLSACGTGAGGGNPDAATTSPSGGSGRQASMDIYNPLVYTPVPNPSDASGVYMLIQRGTVDYTDTDAMHPDDVTDMKTQVSRRRVVILRQEPGLKFRLIDGCSGTDFGLIDDAVTVVSPDVINGRIHASYTKFFNTMPLESDSLLNPLEFTAPFSSTDGAVTNVATTMQFDFIRLHNENSNLGRTTFDYTMNAATHTVQNACLMQTHEQWLATFVGKPAPNQANSVKDYVLASTPDGTQDFFMLMQTADAIAVGIGPIGTGTMNQFTLSVESPYGSIAYGINTLATPGETGAISQTIIRNDTDGLEITGQAINDGSAHFEAGSVNTTYHLNAQF